MELVIPLPLVQEELVIQEVEVPVEATLFLIRLRLLAVVAHPRLTQQVVTVDRVLVVQQQTPAQRDMVQKLKATLVVVLDLVMMVQTALNTLQEVQTQQVVAVVREQQELPVAVEQVERVVQDARILYLVLQLPMRVAVVEVVLPLTVQVERVAVEVQGTPVRLVLLTLVVAVVLVAH